MIRSPHFVVVTIFLVLSCGRQPPVTPLPQQLVTPRKDSAYVWPTTYMAYKFNDEPVIIVKSDGSEPVLYHGVRVRPEQIKAVQVLNMTEARKQFGNQALVGAFLIELK